LIPTSAHTSNFYSALPSFSNFKEIAELDGYSALPADWTLIVSDVVGSTQAIERGAYKNVNMVGAASISAILNASAGTQLPFVFGGDGGLVAVPPDLLDAASTQMKRLKAASLSLFGLDLRVAAIPVSALQEAGAQTLVRKYSLSAGNDLAMFAGDGPALADEWLKADETCRGYALSIDGTEDAPNLEGLSCRWDPLMARNGTMLTLILSFDSDQAAQELHSVTEQIDQILGAQISAFAPAHDDTMHFSLPPSGLAFEVAIDTSPSSKFKSTCWIYFTAFMQYLCERFDIKIGDYNGATYREELKTNTDYRKFDGALRMVLDVTPQQASDIEAFLENEYQAGRLCYGTWQADRAMMTCLLFSLADSQHVHFIDGANGGYAMAAKDLKARLKSKQAG
jgi:hypothetical protein